MFNSSRSPMMLLLFVVIFASCKKNDGPQPSAANNTIVELNPPAQKPVTVNINQYVGGYYESVPNHYQVTTKKYPLLIFLHGAGQEGDGGKDLPLVLNDGIAKMISQKIFPPDFKVDTNHFSFVVLSPQFRAMPSDSMVLSFVNYALEHYRIDQSRIYLVGISMGGILTTEMAGHFSSRFAAVVPISGSSFGTDKEFNATNIASAGIALWGFHNSGDPVMPSTVTTEFVNLVNSHHPSIPGRLTIFQSALHDAWTKALDPSYKENNMNIYEWMLHYKKE
jgi:predicted peptidase